MCVNGLRVCLCVGGGFNVIYRGSVSNNFEKERLVNSIFLNG